MDRIVKQILFDVLYKGKEYRNVDFGYHGDPDVTEEYIHSEDGPWSSVRLGDELIDVQIYATDSHPDVLQIAAVSLIDLGNGKYRQDDYIGSEDINFTNIRVEYEK